MRPPDQRTAYEAAINVISHLVLTKPEVAVRFLANHGIRFKKDPSQKQIINHLIDLIAEGDAIVLKDLERLFAAHLKHKGEELIGPQEDQFLGGALTAAAGIVNGLSGIFGKKKKKKKPSLAHQIAAAQAQAQAKSQAQAQAKAEANMRLAAFKAQIVENRRRDEERRREQLRQQVRQQARQQQERAERLRREERERQQDKAKNRNMMMIGGGVLVALIVTVLLVKK